MTLWPRLQLCLALAAVWARHRPATSPVARPRRNAPKRVFSLVIAANAPISHRKLPSSLLLGWPGDRLFPTPPRSVLPTRSAHRRVEALRRALDVNRGRRVELGGEGFSQEDCFGAIGAHRDQSQRQVDEFHDAIEVGPNRRGKIFQAPSAS